MTALMIRSMTGFARASSPQKKGGWSVEIRSLNHRFLEFSLKTPPSLYGLEDRIRGLCQTQIRRGKVTLSIGETDASELEEVALDEEVLRFYLSAIRKIQREFRLNGSLSVGDVLTLPRIFSVEKKAQAPEKLWVRLKPLLQKALKQLLESRSREGKVLSRDLLTRIRKIEARLLQIERRTQRLPQEHFERLRGRIQQLLGERVEEGQGQNIWQAAALIAEKADITEESVRLKSHLRLFCEKLSAKNEEIGKELDFLLQEMNREANTISAKAQDFGISREVVSIKAELEKIREQIQNIE